MRTISTYGRKATAGTAVTALVAGALAALVVASPSASADPGPIAARTSTNVTADALPTAQIDGVVWGQAIHGDTVYVGGQFAKARPAGVALNGAGSVSRTSLMSYTLSTGVMTSWAPVMASTAVIKAVALSPDGTRLYVAGSFTSIDGATHNRLAAYNTATNTLISTFTPNLDASVNAIAVTNTTVYVGGIFSHANGSVRGRLAAFTAATGALTTWNPNADYNVNALVISPDGTRVFAGGAFQNVGGQAEYGLVATDASTGAVIPWAVNGTVRNAGTEAAIESLSTDGTNIYGTGYVFGSGGNLEGAFNANPSTGAINWIEDCHGDTYDSFPMNGTLYVVSHEHYCGNIGAFPQTSPTWTFQHTTAFTTTATGTIGHDPYGYFDWFGQPSPSQLNWYPDMTVGSYTGQSQSAWTVTGNGQYLVEGGEFPTVNGAAQQGLVRFAVPSIAPNKQGPRVSGSNFKPTLVSLAPGTVRVSFPLNYDRDDKTLTYKVTRNGQTASPVYTLTADSEFWNRPNVGFTDSGLTPGSTVSYRLYATDPDGNQVIGDTTSITLPTGTATPLSQYGQDVKADGASHYWRLGESSGSTGFDWAGYDDLTEGAGVTDGAPGAIAGDSNTAASFNGSAVDANNVNTGLAVDPTPVNNPTTFTEEAWFQTTSHAGGKIVGFGNAATGNSTSYDRHIYMTTDGHLNFGVYNGNTVVVSTPTAYNDGQWHQVVATLDATKGMTLYVDGKKIGANSNTVAQNYQGYWRVGGDVSWSGANYFTGNIDDVAIYPTALGLPTVQKHFIDAGGNLPTPTPAPTDQYGKAVYTDTPDVYYRMNETTGTTATDYSGNANNGVYSGSETLGAPSPVGGTGTAVQFNGTNGTLASGAPVQSPGVYSEEAWFNTTTTHGGKIIGFGSNQTGNSGNYDRHVYMENNGQLEFGTWTGQMNLATSPASYNDGQWHYVVATQGADGMKLYVDNVLVATNGQTQAQDYTGYWRIGGDSDWGGDSAYFNGAIDEAAAYSSVLTPTQIAAHYAASGLAPVPNQAPTAAFTSSATNLNATFDGSTSADPDGTVASYAWDFGDGQTGTGVSPAHSYANAGTYTVSLTVTDNKGQASAPVTHPITVAAANQLPTAAFTATPTNLSVAVNGSASTDQDGTIASYSWNYGDNTALATGATPAAHVYAAAGTYTIGLTVTDNAGGTNTVTHVVAVTAPANQLPTAAFTSTVSNLSATVNGSTSSDPDGTIASYAWDFGDSGTATGATPAAHLYATGGTYPVKLTVTDNAGGTATVTHNVTVTAAVNQLPTAAFGTTINGLAVTADGSASTDADGTITSYAWNFGDNGTDTTGPTPAPHTYAAAGTYTITLTVTDNSGGTKTITHDVTVTAPANQSPSAAFTTSVSNLSVTVSASTSADPDGSIASYAWDFGDGGTATGVTPSAHTYAAAGPYTITLVVTDNQGATDSITHNVTATAPAATAFATDAFGRTVSNGFGSADVGGAWTVTGGTANFSVNGTTGRVSIATAGAGPTALLGSLSQANVNAVIDTSIGSAATGGGVYINLMARHTATGDYRLKEHFVAGGAVQLILTKMVSGTETTLKTVNIAGVTYTPGDVYKLRFVVDGTGGAGSTTLSGTIWKAGTAEPAIAQITAADTTAALQVPGSFGFQSYLSGSSTSVPVAASYDNLSITPVGPAPTNQAPSAAFTTTVSNLAVTANGSTSADPDGTIASYAWNYGDSTTASGATPAAHTYANPGTYTVSLTVTDNQGATNTVTHPVTVTAGVPTNQPPAAAFSSSVANLVATFDGSGSTDDGTIASYAWNFGDGGASTSVNPSHTYANAGTYNVTLTVTDNGGLTNAVSHSVTTTAPGVTTFATDVFGRTTTSGWGTADFGGAWTPVSQASSFSVANGIGSVSLKTAGSGPIVYLASLAQANINAAIDTSANVAATGGGSYATLIARHSGTSDYRLKEHYVAGGAIQLVLSRVINNVETTIKTVNVAGVTYTPGDVYRMRFVVNGTGTTSLTGTIWKVGTTEPATAQISATDTTAALQSAGSFGIQSYVSASSTAVPVVLSYGNLSIIAPQ